MNQINLLRQTLKPLLGWHGARLNFLALFIIALLRVKTINMVELANGFRSQAKSESSYKRLQRFFRYFNVKQDEIAKIVVKLMAIPQPWILSIDRTEWSFGKTHFNILMLGVVHNGVAYPLLWKMLDKKGNSNSEERIDLLERFGQTFPDATVDYLCGDREFVGQEWISYLLRKNQMGFRIRIRQSDKISDGQRNLKAAVVFDHLLPEQTQVLAHKRLVWGLAVYVAGLRLDDGELLIVISSNSPQTAITDYANRWGIETLFGLFKTRGFCLESTHFKDAKRLSKLISLMTLALCWAISTGQWLHQHQPLKIKKHGRKAKGIFRYGLDYLRSIVLDLDLKQEQFLYSLQFLSCT
ncbi:transposase family protein [Xenococcus sp. PCC 7305]|uniref:IS4 family transposase n=1 Tax=Xenococcus sp. PCC 7305 TaxID=102125 RepID=UPI0002ACE550|nr:IS4 family transposase [Xenococcus sp. PCC 7305]ELS04298.1 transposase family protein [Xenococcus sp. PCC 7305]